MRERGAQATDIVVLVVAANDGVKPQTVESIRHIKEAKVPVVVALNKIDLNDVNPDLAKAGLAEHEIIVTDYGGDVEMIPISAIKGTGVDKLLETIQITAELLELQADPEAPLEAVVIEALMDKRRGPVASVIVKQGTLRIRQDVSAGEVEGRIRQLVNAQGEALQEVRPGFPAEIIGFKDVPSVGALVRDRLAVYSEPGDDQSDLSAGDGVAKSASAGTGQVDDFAGWDFGEMIEAKPKLKMIIKADTEGTLEAIMQTLDDESTEVLFSGVGQITERDIELADASGAVIINFHTKVPGQIKLLAKNQGVKIKSYDIIYHLIEDLQKQMLKLLEPTIDEVVTGEAEILQIFEMKGERIAGCKVKSGEIKRSDLLHLKRGDEIIANPVIKNLMHGKEDIPVAKVKSECGMTFKNRKLDFQVGDTLVAYKVMDEEV
jgi:translation initiation factor IF-2